MGLDPPHPNPLPTGERVETEFAARLLPFPRKRDPITTGLWNMGPRVCGDGRQKIRSRSEPQRHSIIK